jgi:DNA-binding response OmpR family regulator
MSAGDVTPPIARILVVEDDALSRDMLTRRMAARGFAVDGVATGEDALQWVSDHPGLTELVLLDVNLPGLSGLEVVTELRKRFTRDALPVILVTAMAESDDVIRGLAAGANDYVVKPINFAVLMARAQVCLRIKSDVKLLMEAERQRVLIKALGEACHQLAQPMQAMTMTLEGLIHFPDQDQKESTDALRDILRWTEQVGAVIHRMQEVSTLRPLPFIDRMDILGQGSPDSEGVRRGQDLAG